jgi:hypothetical protein
VRSETVTDRRGVAFFDVDETLVSVRTLESLLRD